MQGELQQLYTPKLAPGPEDHTPVSGGLQGVLRRSLKAAPGADPAKFDAEVARLIAEPRTDGAA
ncbi:MAG: hypothetical protein ACU0CO_01300 [Shimia sp.]